MLRHKTIAIVLSAYNEAGFIGKTLKSVPLYVDLVICVDDGSTDATLKEISANARKDKRIHILQNRYNSGIGFSYKRGISKALDLKADFVVIAAGDNQNDLSIIRQLVEKCILKNYDVCRGNRFLNRSELIKMPPVRRLGNSIYSFITKFVSGYYSLFDFQSSFGAFSAQKLKEIYMPYLRNDSLFDNSLWINLNIVNARITEVPIEIIYEGEISSINYFSFVSRSIPYLLRAYLQRIYTKYFLILHPVGLYLITGCVLFVFGLCFGIYIAVDSIGPNTASTATVMLSVVPFILGFQLLLQAFTLDIYNEPK